MRIRPLNASSGARSAGTTTRQNALALSAASAFLALLLDMIVGVFNFFCFTIGTAACAQDAYTVIAIHSIIRMHMRDVAGPTSSLAFLYHNSARTA